jgi:hypothetical protein
MRERPNGRSAMVSLTLPKFAARNANRNGHTATMIASPIPLSKISHMRKGKKLVQIQICRLKATKAGNGGKIQASIGGRMTKHTTIQTVMLQARTPGAAGIIPPILRMLSLMVEAGPSEAKRRRKRKETAGLAPRTPTARLTARRSRNARARRLSLLQTQTQSNIRKMQRAVCTVSDRRQGLWTTNRVARPIPTMCLITSFEE